MLFDTIVAPITGTQPAAVAIVRLSGEDAWSVASKVFSNWPEEPESHKAVYGRLVTGDDGLVLPFAEGHSYTGDETVEFSIHGSPASVRALVEACIGSGARMAEPGEFTQRAFLNGRIDLTQAEGVRDTILAQTDAQLRQANLHREGVLHRKVEALRAEILTQLIAVEASVDFSEEIGDFDRTAGAERLTSTLQEIENLIATAAAGRILREGLRIAIVGPPNAGKSSLLNALLGSERAIVTEVAGTTRDYVEEQVDIGGVLCVLYDTAGLRDTEDRVESIGIQRARAIADNVDEIWYLYDATIGWTDQDEASVASFERPVTVLANKSDVAAGERGILISATTGAGLQQLKSVLASKMDKAAGYPLINRRHEGPLREAAESIEACLSAMKNHLPDDLLSVGLSEAAMKLGEITGEAASPDIIDRIFHDFCIGK